jgi:CHRD domain
MKLFLRVFLALVIAALSLPSLGFTAPITYIAHLDGPSESPPNASPGTGLAYVFIDTTAQTLQVDVTAFSGLLGMTTASHIHAATAIAGTGTAGVATTTPTFPGFPLGVTSGTYDQTFDMTLLSTWNPAYVTAHGGTAAGAEAAFVTAVAEGKAYLNIHTTVVPSGEIRGFLVAPIPASMLLFGTGLAGLAGCRFRKKK